MQEEFIMVQTGVITVLLQVVLIVFGTIMLIKNAIHVTVVVASFLKIICVLMRINVELDSMQKVAIINAQLVYHLVLPVKVRQIVCHVLLEQPTMLKAVKPFTSGIMILQIKDALNVKIHAKLVKM